MPDREKVIKGLTELKKYLASTIWEPINDAIALLKESEKQKFFVDENGEITPLPIVFPNCPLKEQEAELLTFEEVKNHFHVPIKLLGDIEKYVDFENDIEPLYLECDIEDAWTVHWRTYDNTKEYLETWEKDYGKTWRCWTKKPTEEQKRSVKWE